MKPELGGVSESALITLCARACEAAHPRSVLSDPHAERVVAGLDYDFSRLRRSTLTCCGLAIRARVVDDWARDFIANSESPRLVTLGCGLDARSERVGGNAAWLDVDLPAMEAPWRRFCERGEQRFIACSLDDEAWLAALPTGGDTRVIIEGLLMYLEPERVARVFRLLRERLPEAEVWADVLSPLASRMAPFHRPVAAMGNSFRSGWRPGQALEGYRLAEEHSLYDLHSNRWGAWHRLGRLPLVGSSWRLLRLRPTETESN